MNALSVEYTYAQFNLVPANCGITLLLLVYWQQQQFIDIRPVLQHCHHRINMGRITNQPAIMNFCYSKRSLNRPICSSSSSSHLSSSSCVVTYGQFMVIVNNNNIGSLTMMLLCRGCGSLSRCFLIGLLTVIVSSRINRCSILTIEPLIFLNDPLTIELTSLNSISTTS